MPTWSPADIDAVVRTIYGEARGEPVQGQQAAAGVMVNRVRAGAPSLVAVAHEPHQFDAWRVNGPALARLSPNDPHYQQILANIQPVLNGDINPAGNADHFVNLAAANPAWAHGNPSQQIGNHTFVAAGYRYRGGGNAQPVQQAGLGDGADLFGLGGGDRANPAPAAPQQPAGGLGDGADIFGLQPEPARPARPQTPPGARPGPPTANRPPRGITPANAQALLAQVQRNGAIFRSMAGPPAGPTTTGSFSIGAVPHAVQPSAAEQDRARLSQAPLTYTPRPIAALSGRPGGWAPQERSIVPQMLSNMGIGDEGAGLMAYGTQAVMNAGRTLTGQEQGISPRDAYHTAANLDRQQQAEYAQQHPYKNLASYGLGFLTAGAPNAQAAAPAGNLIQRTIGAAKQGVLSSIPYVFANQQGDVAQRIPGTIEGSLLAGGFSGGLQAGGSLIGSLGRLRQAHAPPPSAQRTLSEAGVRLTPGQIMGGTGQNIEDALTSQPVLGAAIRSEQNRSLSTFNRAAHNQSLAPIGERLPTNIQPGRAALKWTQRAISNFYNTHLNPVTVAPDAQLVTDLQTAVGGIQNDAMRSQFRDILDHQLSGQINGRITGRQWKDMDAQLGAVAQQARNGASNNPVMGQLGDGLTASREAFRGLMQRQHPQVASAIDAADLAHANMLRIQEAMQQANTARRGGVFTAPQLNTAARAMDSSNGNRAYAQGDALMQNLTEPGMQVLPPTIGDSGTAGRMRVSMSIPDVVSATLNIIPATLYKIAAPVVNQIYRASAPGRTEEGIRQLALLAQRHPALEPLLRQVNDSASPRARRQPPPGQLALPIAR